jgi:hypothetical protein
MILKAQIRKTSDCSNKYKSNNKKKHENLKMKMWKNCKKIKNEEKLR